MKYKKILMLDIDGVLNNVSFLQNCHAVWLKMTSPAKTFREADRFRMEQDLSPDNIKNLKKILREIPDLRIVLSSTWRLTYNLEDIKTVFKKFGIPKYKVIGKTPHKMSMERCHEILSWLQYNNFEGCWAAVDDVCIFSSPEYIKHEFHTESSDGLTEAIADNIIKYFKKEIDV